MRLNRFLARAGLASRRKAEEIILAGKVSVNGTLTTSLATEISPGDTVEVGGEIIELPSYKYYLLNKPSGYTCTRADKHAEKTVFELLPNDKSLFTIGRLDRETTGLLLVTNDGDFAQNIIHPSKKIAKVYRIKLSSVASEGQINHLLEGVSLEDGPAKAKRVTQAGRKEIELTIEEGRKRIVRRMIDVVGNHVEELKRIKIGDIDLDVELGKYRLLSDDEVNNYV